MPTEPNERGPLIETPFVHDEIDWVDPYHGPPAPESSFLRYFGPNPESTRFYQYSPNSVKALGNFAIYRGIELTGDAIDRRAMVATVDS